MYSLIKTAVVLLVIGLVLFLLWRSARKARTTATVLNPADIEALRAARELDQTTVIPAVAVPEIGAPTEAVTLNQFIDNQPDDVASMLRTWLSDGPSKVQS